MLINCNVLYRLTGKKGARRTWLLTEARPPGCQAAVGQVTGRHSNLKVVWLPRHSAERGTVCTAQLVTPLAATMQAQPLGQLGRK